MSARRNLAPVPSVGEWSDIGTGHCARCKTERRLYQPIGTVLTLCAPCTQAGSYRSMSNQSRDEADMLPELETKPTMTSAQRNVLTMIDDVGDTHSAMHDHRVLHSLMFKKWVEKVHGVPIVKITAEGRKALYEGT